MPPVAGDGKSDKLGPSPEGADKSHVEEKHNDSKVLHTE